MKGTRSLNSEGLLSMPSPTPPQPEEHKPVVVHYFIDEAGDPVLFGNRKVIALIEERSVTSATPRSRPARSGGLQSAPR
jgi:hypothetical protein